MSPPLPIILVGCGAVAQQFYRPALGELQKTGLLQVQALVDPVESARNTLAASFPRAQSTADWLEIESPPGSLAIIASPPRFHAAQTVAAFERGWHVLCEKPMASSVEEAQTMIAAARQRGRLLAIGLYKRFFPSSRYLRTLCQQSTLGPLREFTVSEGGPFRWPAASPSFFDKSQTPGGVLLDIGVHVLDLLDWLLGEPATFHYTDDAMGGLETNVVLELHYGGGTRGCVHLSRDWDTPQLYQFVFERGLVRWRVNDANGLSVQLHDTPACLHATLHAPVSPAELDLPSPRLDSNPQSFLAQLQNVVAAVQGRETLLVDGESGLRSLRLIEACYAGRTLLEQPWLTPAEAERARALNLT